MKSWALAYRVIVVAQEGRLWPAVRYAVAARWSAVREWYYRLRLGLARTMPGGSTSPVLSGRFDATPEATRLRECLDGALIGESPLPHEIRGIKGMSGQRYRAFINGYVRATSDARYLEVGSWAGSTAAAALYGNRVEALCIDNWSEFGGPREAFFSNIELARSEHTRLRFLERDFRAVDYAALGSFNIYLFDGPHGEVDQCDGVLLAQPAVTDRYLLIVDDWNWRAVRNGTLRALHRLRSRIEAAVEIRTTLDDSHPQVSMEKSDWHNGYFLAVVRKQGAD